METWRIAIPIVVFILCVIGAWYVIRLMKNPVSGEWFNALIYQGMENGELYVREYKDFFDKFVKLLDWENETKESGQC